MFVDYLVFLYYRTRFAKRCIKTFAQVIREFSHGISDEVLSSGSLDGSMESFPTSDLRARCGLHSGPVTAGVLRSDKARFQIFGDTVLIANRMESTSEPYRIHISKETADLLVAAGYEHWVKARDGLVNMVGEGEVRTFWADPHDRTKATSKSVETPSTGSKGSTLDSDDIMARNAPIAFHDDATYRGNARLKEGV